MLGCETKRERANTPLPPGRAQAVGSPLRLNQIGEQFIEPAPQGQPNLGVPRRDGVGGPEWRVTAWDDDTGGDAESGEKRRRARGRGEKKEKGKYKSFIEKRSREKIKQGHAPRGLYKEKEHGEERGGMKKKGGGGRSPYAPEGADDGGLAGDDHMCIVRWRRYSRFS